ncbi:hypothetical protein BV898_00832 [Hypsibius exemplaris]|uniref:Uncharacterized protein n=1 Tax=Hypsibius exemplaris TaxID=2072580 RepID=A0A1W0XCR1_HYPEX|nr:hypothetical protein BV898_00832 [Hypsibius exemplaris]
MRHLVRPKSISQLSVWSRCQSQESSAPSSIPKSKLSNYSKRVLVWTKRYPNLESVPDNVPASVMSRAYDRFRWKLAMIGMGLTILGSIGMVISGKRAAARGESTLKKGLAWHEELKPGSTKSI